MCNRIVFFLFIGIWAVADSSLLNVQSPVNFFKIDKANPEKTLAAFHDFVKKYKKEYKSEAEKAHRLNVFTKNFDYINKRNEEAKANGETLVLGVNNFADMTKEELDSFGSHTKPSSTDDLPTFDLKSHLRKNKDLNGTRQKRSHKSSLPKEFDLRDVRIGDKSIVGPVKSQGGCACCWGFSLTAVTESAFALYNKEFLPLSEQEVCDCGTTGVPGCVGGDPVKGAKYVYQYGQGLESDYPYVDGRANVTGMCRLRFTDRALPRKSLNFFKAHPRHVEEDIMSAIYNKYTPIAVYFKVGQSLFHYESGILVGQDCLDEKKPIYHSTAIVGWGSFRDPSSGKSYDYWIMKNSWSDYWGEDGYFKIARGVDWCGCEDLAVGAEVVGYNY